MAMTKIQEHSMMASQAEGMMETESIAMMQAQNENQIQDSQQKMIAIAEHIQLPISTRYDDIYHPRTDKRVICKYSLQANISSFGLVLYYSVTN